MRNYRLKAYIYLILVAAIWGIAGPVIKYTLGAIDPLPFLTIRFFISSLVALPMLIFRKTNIFTKDHFKNVIIFGFLTSTLALGLLFAGLERTTVLDASFITLTAPLLVTAAGVVYLKERVTKKEKIGMSIAFIGSLILIIQPILANGRTNGQLLGNILILGYLVANTASVIYAKKNLRERVDPLDLVNMMFVIGFVTLLPLTLYFYKGEFFTQIASLNKSYLLGILYMALISGSLAYYLWIKAQKSIEVGEAALFGYLNPIFAAPLALFWLGETLTPIFILGAIIIIIGVVVAEYKPGIKR
jgi:drug/metabolite transporter (DMT)-like permease